MTDTSEIKEMYENMFTHRFTQQDEEYQEYLRKPENQPPMVEEWWGGNQRHQDRYRDNRRNRGWDNRRDSYNSYNQHQGGRGWGNGSNQYRQDRSSYHSERPHSYNSGNQRFHPYR